MNELPKCLQCAKDCDISHNIVDVLGWYICDDCFHGLSHESQKAVTAAITSAVREPKFVLEKRVPA
jgi:hypothetical protein